MDVSMPDLDDGTELAAVLFCGMDGSPPRVAEAPMCPTHNRAMKRLQYPTKHGHQWHYTAKMGDDWCEERA
jgi:hypothetical protein